ncbi:hypothetical protein ACWEOE_34110 [Amycolatopsis sp. NPDC004368]
MSSKPLAHRGTTSWWNGTFTTLCGITVQRSGTKSPLFPNKCPVCEAIHNAKKGR